MNTECPRCGKNYEKYEGFSLRVDGQRICEECFTPEEEYAVFETAHFLVTGHRPDTPECHCEFDDA